jgi:beta-lactamase class D
MIITNKLGIKNKRIMVSVTLGLLGLLTACQVLSGPAAPEAQLQAVFERAGVTGGILIYDLERDELLTNDLSRVDNPFIPASTFKILNALIALETGQVMDADEVIPWDGVDRGLPAWNQDHSLRTAFQASAVWFFQEMARRTGPELMANYVAQAGYGSQNIAGPIDSFWLDGELRISARQQIDFLRRLQANQLPFSEHTLNTVKDIMVYETTTEYVLRAKTGWGLRAEPQVGWFVGYMTRGEDVIFFATQIDISDPSQAPLRESITRQALQALGHLDRK